MNRRRFLQTAAAGGAMAVAPGTWVLAARRPEPGLPGADEGEVVFRSSFEPGDPMPPTLDGHTVTDAAARTGKRSLVGEVKGPNAARFLEIPLTLAAGRLVHIECHVRSDQRSACAVWLRSGGKRISLGRTDRIPAGKWKRVTATWRADEAFAGVVQIVAPSSFNAPVGRMWIDDVTVTTYEDPCDWPAFVHDFPATAADAKGRVWMATLQRPVDRGLICIYRLDGTEPREGATLDPKPCTAVAPPAIAAAGDGCVVAFPVECDDRWRIACAFVAGKRGAKPAVHTIAHGGNANINPAVAVHDDRATVLWETNADGCRRIAACRVGPDGPGECRTLSAAGASAYNPAVVARTDGSLFAAWDAFRDGSADVYGAVCRDGRWSAPRRLTSDGRIERHPHLAARGSEVWMAWQAQSYPDSKINLVTEQRICVARVDGDRLLAPKGHAAHVLGCPGRLLRPQVAFDPSGRLWLSARRAVGRHGGWEPLVWCCGGDEWSGPHRLLHQYGRWRPVPMAWGDGGGRAVCQFDDLPDAWREQGIRPDWKSGLAVRTLPAEALPPAGPPETEPLAMPETDFALAEKRALVAADLPRETLEHAGTTLTLYWGDFHDHTDLSVCQRELNPPGHDLLANERDIEQLDFVALTDHGYNFDPPQWAFNGAQIRANHDPGRFVTFLGEEWTSDHIPYKPPRHGTQVGTGRRVVLRRYGHRNLIFLDPHGKRFFDSRDGDIPPAEVWERFEPGRIIAIPHQLADLGNRPTDWSCHDPRYQPVAEIWQTRGSYEYAGCPRQAGRSMKQAGHYLQDAWARGLVIGVIASPDHGGGKGKVGVWAEALTREALFRAVLARHTFGTSGPKMAVLLRTAGAMMGDVAERPAGAIALEVRATAARPIRQVVLFRNNEIVHRSEPGRTEFNLQWTDAAPPAATADAPRLWYYARIESTDDELAWTSPIWFA